MRIITKAIIFAITIPAIASSAYVAAQVQGDDAHTGPTMNHHRVDERLSTGGHFVEGGLAAIHEQGIRVVIDLRDKPPANQKQRLAELGIEWINIPVVWASPEKVDFERFSDAMSKHAADNVLVQCQANYRASAMTYLYRVLEQQIPEAEARKDLLAVWEPSGRWATYMNEILGSVPVAEPATERLAGEDD
ncbi:MAG: protein tyrosine phosphatase family protein [Gammaproteobacteria bacterium]|nr:protein tyrosine phosphatase family protein [Gammaproteobacteria bacterium]MDH3372536.1 protein tyrosine phosphatase family protein [Gammaproteobacteria bacterium]MDH3408042.1 protein tyrosine phosphatase family protein [Gammaproteobacteria bacterium]MDH3551976.1 protein tyrosine phosphatase family protein [Gammaproteobacteria bacterium]